MIKIQFIGYIKDIHLKKISFLFDFNLIICNTISLNIIIFEIPKIGAFNWKFRWKKKLTFYL